MLLPREQRSMGSHVWATVASESVPRTYNSLQGLGSLLRGLGSLRIHVRRAPRDGSASTLAEQQPLRRHHTMTCTSPGLGRGYPPLCQPLCAWLPPMPHCAADSCPENNAAWGATSGLLWPRNQYPGPIILSRASAVCCGGSTARGPMSAGPPAMARPRLLQSSSPLRRHHAATSTSPAMSCIQPYWSPTTHKIEYDQHVTSARQGRGHSINHTTTVAGYRARTRHLY